MLKSYFQRLFADPKGTAALVRRLLLEQAAGQWRRYALAFALMAIAAASTALGAYLIGDVINQAYVHKNLPGIIMLALVTAVIFMIKGMATYGQAVALARIGNGIIADNQRRMFAKLLQHNVGFFADRHSSEFIARLTTGAAAASHVLNLLITSLGRDLLSLIGLAAVMAVQDPVLSMLSVVVVPPAMLILRKMIRRIKMIAHDQFTGSARVLETLQETLQGMRIIKAFTLEEDMRGRFDARVADLENESNKWARVAYRSGPLMEALGGFAIAGALVYGGFRVIETGATPGQFFSFLAAFMLAYEPAKRLARLNIDLNSGLVGVRILFDVIDHPATEPADEGKPPLKLSKARLEFANVQFAYRPGEKVIRNLSFVAGPGNVAAGGANQGGDGAGLGHEGQIPDHFLARPIRELDVREFDPRLRKLQRRLAFVARFGLGMVDDVEQDAHPDQPAAEVDIEPSEGLGRLIRQHEGCEKREELAWGRAGLAHAEAAVDQCAGDRESAERLHQRARAVGDACPLVRFVLEVGNTSVEAGAHVLFQRERLEDAHALQ